jgi:hypothetical protein
LIIAGPIADKLGVQTWFIIGGVVTGIMGIGSFFIPAIMHFEDDKKEPVSLVAEKYPMHEAELGMPSVEGASITTPVKFDCT